MKMQGINPYIPLKHERASLDKRLLKEIKFTSVLSRICIFLYLIIVPISAAFIYISSFLKIEECLSAPCFERYRSFILLSFIIIPFLCLGIYLIWHFSKFSSHRKKRAIRLLVHSLSRDYPAPRAVFDAWKSMGLQMSYIKKFSIDWIDWPGGAEKLRIASLKKMSPVQKFECRPLFLEMNTFSRWLSRQNEPVCIKSFLEHLTIIYKTRYPKTNDLLPVDFRCPKRISGPDAPCFIPYSPGIRKKNDSLSIKLLKMICGIYSENDSDIDYFRMNIRGFDRNNVLEREKELRESLKKLCNRKSQFNKNEYLYKTRYGKVAESDFKSYQKKRKAAFRVNFSLRISKNGEESIFCRLNDLETLIFIHGLLFYFYSCPWDWKNETKNVEIECRNGKIMPVSFHFNPEKEISVKRIQKSS
jgi:hypothetical protein